MKYSFVLGVVLCSAAVSAFAQAPPGAGQVSVTGQQSADKAVTGLQVSVSTMDRTYVPLKVQTKQTQVDATTKRAQSVTQARLNDGSYFDYLSTTMTTSQTDPNTTQTVIDTVEKDRQGNDRATGRVTAQTVKTPDGERSNSSTYRRDSDGKLILDTQVAATTTKNADGSLNTLSVENRADVDGKLRKQKEVEQTVVLRGPNDKQVVSQVKTPNHLDGSFGVTSRETANIRTDGNSTSTETLIQKPTGTGWQDVGKIVTTETRDANGSVRRETVEQGQSLYDQKSPKQMDPLVAQRKIVESEVRKPDGTVTLDRNVFRRDINGDWKPASFSTEAAGKAAY